jgi:hypothetical protein
MLEHILGIMLRCISIASFLSFYFGSCTYPFLLVLFGNVQVLSRRGYVGLQQLLYTLPRPEVNEWTFVFFFSVNIAKRRGGGDNNSVLVNTIL